MHRRLFATSTLALGVALTTPAFAEDGIEDGRNDIIVTASRSELPVNALPLTIDIIGKDVLDQQVTISGSVTDAVATLTPSFSPTRQKLSGAGESLRGRSPLFAINAIPQTTPMRDGSRDGFTIDSFFIERVEVIFGSNSLQGIGTGGIINQVTVGAPKEEGLSGRVLVQGSADGDFRGEGFGWKVGGLTQYKAGDFDATIGATFEKRGVYFDAHDQRVGLNLTQGETQDSKANNLFLRLGYAITPTGRLDLIASRFEIKSDADYIAVAGVRRPLNSPLRDVPTSAIRGDAPGKAAASRTESIALTYSDSDIAGGRFISQIFYNRTRDTFGGEVAPVATFQDPALAPIGTLFDQSQNRSRKMGAKFSYERTLFDALNTVVGFDALWDKTEQALISTGRVWVPPSDFRSLAPFAQLNLKLFDGKIRLAGGARWENVTLKIDDFNTLASTTAVGNNPSTYGGVAVSGGKPKFNDLLLNGGVIVEPWDGIRAYGSYAEGFTMPDIGRITRAINQRGVDLDNYLTIEPVVSNNLEVGAEVKRGPIDASVAYFWSTSDKGQLLIPGADRIFNVQRQRVEIDGLELNLRTETPIQGLKLGIGYAHINGRYDSDATRGAPDGKVDTDLDGANISPDRVNLSATYQRGGVSALVQSQFYLARNFRADQGKPTPDQRNNFGGYNVTDASIRYESDIGGLTLSAANIFNTFYIDYSSDTRLPTDPLAIFAGRGRSFTLSWDYRF
jgi:iron complex outermembrane receptor protein